MYTGHARLCVCLFDCLSAAACPQYCTDPDVTFGNGRGYAPPSCALLGGFAIGARVALLWQHSANAKCQRVLVLLVTLRTPIHAVQNATASPSRYSVYQSPSYAALRYSIAAAIYVTTTRQTCPVLLQRSTLLASGIAPVTAPPMECNNSWQQAK